MCWGVEGSEEPAHIGGLWKELRAGRYHAIERVLLPLFCHQGSWWGPGLYAAGSYVWVYCSAAAGLYVDISDSCYHRGPCRGLLSEPTPEAMLVFDSHVGIGTRWSRWQVLLPGSMMTFILELKVRAKSESIALLQPGSVLISVTILTIEGQVDVPPGDTLAVCQTVSEAMPVWVICKVS